MNGIHDMGGMHGMGVVVPERDEPVFHEEWEGRVFALRRAMGAWRRWNIDATRYGVERLPPADYLAMSYYERQFAAFLDLLVQVGLVTRSELDAGVPAPDTSPATPALTVEKARALVTNGVPTSRPASDPPRFHSGQRVRARTLNPVGHTRLPRYARGRVGTVEHHRGVFVFPDSNAHFLGEQPQHVYSVRFGARELWGDNASPCDAVYLDLWDDYLELA
jgi:nitrile hydratase subunit beta